MAVVDASVVVDWVAPDVAHGSPALQLADRLAEAGEPLTAPSLLLQECANALLMGVRKGRWSGLAADDAFARLRQLPVTLVDDRRDLDRAYELSRRYDEHPVSDMVYVALAERLGDRLVTADAELRRKLTLMAFVVATEDAFR